MSAPKACLRAASGVMGFRWRVWEEKPGLPGLAQEAQEICYTVGLPNICQVEVSKEDIKENIY